jgi:hypothetical protein
LEGPVSVHGENSGASRLRRILYVGFANSFAVHGLLDVDPTAKQSMLQWIDPVTKSNLSGAFRGFAPRDVELVSVEGK